MPLWGICPKERKTYGTQHLPTDVYGSCFHYGPNLEAAEKPTVGDGHVPEVHPDNRTLSALKRDEPGSHEETWGKRKCMLPSERSHPHCVIPTT